MSVRRFHLPLASLLLLLSALIARAAPASDDDASVVVSDARTDAAGFLVHDVRSPYQRGVTQIRVLCPDRLDRARRYPVVYVLPVEAGVEHRFGDGLREIKRLDLANRHQAIFVAPTFSHLPWYADHPTDPTIRQETYLLKVVLPFVEQHYPARDDAGGRLLLGFSKSGWGAFSLLLRHPELFGKAAAWDAPLMMDKPGKYGSGEIFGSVENFRQYQITRLLDSRAADLRQEPRLILLGYGNFREEHVQAHALMERLKIAHVYEDGPHRKHEWGSGWLPEAVDALFAAPPKTRPSTTRPAGASSAASRAAPSRPGFGSSTSTRLRSVSAFATKRRFRSRVKSDRWALGPSKR